MGNRCDKIAADTVGLLEPSHQALLTLVELRPVVLGPAAGLLVEVPEDHLGARQRTDECGADRGEGPRGVGMPIRYDLVADRAVGEEHERDCQQINRPVLVKGYQRDDHEKVEVHFRLSMRDMDQHDRAAQQAEAGGERAQPADARKYGRAEQQRRRAGRDEPLPDTELLVSSAADDDRQMDGENPDQQSVAGDPVLRGQAPSVRNPAPGLSVDLVCRKHELGFGSMAGRRPLGTAEPAGARTAVAAPRPVGNGGRGGHPGHPLPIDTRHTMAVKDGATWQPCSPVTRPSLPVTNRLKEAMAL